MSEMIDWIAAEAERRPEQDFEHEGTRRTAGSGEEVRKRAAGPSEEELRELRAHQFSGGSVAGGGDSKTFTTEDAEGHRENQDPALAPDATRAEDPSVDGVVDDTSRNHLLPGSAEYQAALIEEYREADEFENNRERRIYRGRTIAKLRRYMKYAIECGRLPSLLGREFFRTQVTTHTTVTFEDRVIFVHDMEMSLKKLDEFSQQLIARHILQEHDCWATAKLLHCNEKTVRRLIPMALDQMSEILLDAGLLDRLDSSSQNSCQGGFEGQNSVSDCEEGK
jgi:hypothetical protein